MSPDPAAGLVARLEESVFRLLLRAYGRPFRGRYFDELIVFFRQDRRAPEHRGLRGAWRFWRHTLHDLAASSLRDRTRNLPQRLIDMLHDVTTDLRLALRGILREPAFAAVAILSLALGLGSTATIFSVVDAALIRALPFPAADRLVMIQGTLRSDRQDVRAASYPEIGDWRRGTDGILDGLSAFSAASVNLGADEGLERVVAELVDAPYFRILGAATIRGRFLLPEDNGAPDASPVVLISEELWERAFGRDEGILGRSIRINDRDLTVVGILDREFRGIALDTDLWMPMMMASVIGRGDLLDARGQRWLAAIGHLAEGRTAGEAQEAIDATALSLEQEFPDMHDDRTGTAITLRDAYLDAARDTLVALVIAAALVLAIAAANVAGLLAVRWAHRRTEIAVRQALGAGGGRIVRQIVAESALYAVLGAVAGLVLARWLLAGLLTVLPEGVLPAFVAPAIDGRVLGGTLLAILATTAITASLPSWHSLSGRMSGALRRSRTGGDDGRLLSPRRLLVVAEVAVAMALLVGTGLMIRTVAAKLDVPPGFEADGLHVFSVQLPRARYDAEATITFAEMAAARLRNEPEIESVSIGSDAPLSGGTSAGFVRLDPQDEEGRIRYYRHRVLPGYLDTAGARLVKGRDFAADDVAGAPSVALVSREFEIRYLNSDGIGREIWVRPDAATIVVGVVETLRWRDLTTDLTSGGSDPDIYFPFAQMPTSTLQVLVRSPRSATVLLPRVRAAVEDLDPGIPAYGPVDATESLASLVALDRLALIVLGLFSITAAAIAAVGVYGTIAFSVERQRREIAIRMALGATPGSILVRVLASGASMAAVGVVVGAGLATLLGRALDSTVFGVSTHDPATYAVVLLFVMSLVVASTLIPARRATRVQPESALRAD